MRTMCFFPSLILGMVSILLVGCDLKRDSGLWRGSLVMRDSQRPATTCEVEVEITHTDDAVILHQVNSACLAYATVWRPGTFSKDGTALWRNGRNVGWARDDGAVSLELEERDVDERYPLPASRVKVFWSRTGEGLDYTEESSFAGRTLTATGTLRRVR